MIEVGRSIGVALALAGVLTALSARPALAASGDLDTTFGGDGKVVTHFQDGGSASGVAIQADGKVVAVGSAGAGSPWPGTTRTGPRTRASAATGR